jgi:hypothetical protein
VEISVIVFIVPKPYTWTHSLPLSFECTWSLASTNSRNGLWNCKVKNHAHSIGKLSVVSCNYGCYVVICRSTNNSL